MLAHLHYKASALTYLFWCWVTKIPFKYCRRNRLMWCMHKHIHTDTITNTIIFNKWISYFFPLFFANILIYCLGVLQNSCLYETVVDTLPIYIYFRLLSFHGIKFTYYFFIKNARYSYTRTQNVNTWSIDVIGSLLAARNLSLSSSLLSHRRPMYHICTPNLVTGHTNHAEMSNKINEWNSVKEWRVVKHTHTHAYA